MRHVDRSARSNLRIEHQRPVGAPDVDVVVAGSCNIDMQAIAGRHWIYAHIAVGKLALHHRAVAIVADHIGERCGDSDTASCPSEFACHRYRLVHTVPGKGVCEFLTSGFLHLHLCEAICKIAHEGYKPYHIGQPLGSDRNITIGCRFKLETICHSAALGEFIGCHRTASTIA